MDATLVEALVSLAQSGALNEDKLIAAGPVVAFAYLVARRLNRFCNAVEDLQRRVDAVEKHVGATADDNQED